MPARPPSASTSWRPCYTPGSRSPPTPRWRSIRRRSKRYAPARCASWWCMPSRFRRRTPFSPRRTAARQRSPPRTGGYAWSTSGPPGARPAAPRCRRSTGCRRRAAAATSRSSPSPPSATAPEAIARFFAEFGMMLPTALDLKSALAARAMDVPGLPVTVLLDRGGGEVGAAARRGGVGQPGGGGGARLSRGPARLRSTARNCWKWAKSAAATSTEGPAMKESLDEVPRIRAAGSRCLSCCSPAS